MNKIILITGATSGFGEACARKFAAAGGYDIIITGRRKERLETLKAGLENNSNNRDTPSKILPLVFDVRDKKAAQKAIDGLPESWKRIDLLINNAGLALGRDYFDEADMDDWETMIDTNVKGLLYMSRAVLPLMIPQGKGHIINLGSVAAKEIYEKGNVYCATKAAVEAISHSMRIDLLRHNIKVTAIHPGAAETEFSNVRFKGDETLAKKIYEGFTPLYAEDVADTIFYCATLPPHVCLNDIVMTCTAQADAIYFYKK
ncbi:MAG TPA: SDR family NAD(P)-dependent oxidoreductase [Puia sp.]|jgi:NADP-dependent 3-hydroxy acid dehydrogenase YdfG|nr:SDR family NAD(P)-dependent oxidoreductase [Puia sp.]